MTHCVRAEILTPEKFKPFGRLIEVPSGKADVERDYLRWWGGLYDLDFQDTASIGYLEIQRREFLVSELERHVKAAEIFISIEGVSIMPFAPASASDNPEARPSLDKLTAFIVDGTQGMIIERGVWHFPPFPVTQKMGFILIVRKETADDLDIKPCTATSIFL